MSLFASVSHKLWSTWIQFKIHMSRELRDEGYAGHTLHTLWLRSFVDIILRPASMTWDAGTWHSSSNPAIHFPRLPPTPMCMSSGTDAWFEKVEAYVQQKGAEERDAWDAMVAQYLDVGMEDVRKVLQGADKLVFAATQDTPQALHLALVRLSAASRGHDPRLAEVCRWAVKKLRGWQADGLPPAVMCLQMETLADTVVQHATAREPGQSQGHASQKLQDAEKAVKKQAGTLAKLRSALHAAQTQGKTLHGIAKEGGAPGRKAAALLEDVRCKEVEIRDAIVRAEERMGGMEEELEREQRRVAGKVSLAGVMATQETCRELYKVLVRQRGCDGVGEGEWGARVARARGVVLRGLEQLFGVWWERVVLNWGSDAGWAEVVGWYIQHAPGDPRMRWDVHIRALCGAWHRGWQRAGDPLHAGSTGGG